MRRVFVSYRREDSADVTGRICDRLISHFGRENVYMDVDAIPLGADFRDHIDEAVGRCDALLAVIGPKWAGICDAEGKPRLQDVNDTLRTEIGSALARGIPVIPVLVRGSEMPSPESLPADLRELCDRNGTPVRPNPDFDADMSRVVEALEGRGRSPAAGRRRRPNSRKRRWVPMVALMLLVAAAALSSGIVPMTLLDDDVSGPAWARVADDQMAEAKRLGVPVAFEDPLGVRFVLVPTGTFEMGSSRRRSTERYEWPQHEVTLGPFYMATTETTHGTWEAVMGSNIFDFSDRSLPARNVSWSDCRRFLDALNQRGYGTYRLPTEAEWEYACRANSAEPWFFGNDETKLHEYAWFESNSGQRVHPGGGRKPNAWGLYDVYGNVMEWCADSRHSSYVGAPVDGTAWVDHGDGYRIVRGGSSRSSALRARSASRNWQREGDRFNDVGFRLVRSSLDPPREFLSQGWVKLVAAALVVLVIVALILSFRRRSSPKAARAANALPAEEIRSEALRDELEKTRADIQRHKGTVAKLVVVALMTLGGMWLAFAASARSSPTGDGSPVIVIVGIIIASILFACAEACSKRKKKLVERERELLDDLTSG